MPHRLLPASTRTLAAAFLFVCVALTAFLAARYTHQTGAGRFDTAIDIRVQNLLSGLPMIPGLLVRLGDPIPLAALTATQLLTCIATKRWRGAMLVAVAVPGAVGLTELVLKPVIHRTFMGELSFPSGHATGVFAIAVAFAVLLTNPAGPRMRATLRGLLALGAIVAACTSAIAIVAVKSHYATDTVGGASVATAMVLLTALIVDFLADVAGGGEHTLGG